ncbi:MAG: Asp-tRNA(Asn)/Glu-tRNA(Gln) amidotransferase subunit GatB [Gammaproteobacteria bacterium]|nr:Asp-tRNA(Asn)/Glu-tRNA(Gln) amidotransferase subunit GatB [Gammaproteobacteria bacterium]
MSSATKYETVIGLEVHAQLATNSKIFSAASTDFGAKPNSQACLVDLGYPGVLPVLNAKCVTMAVKFGLAIGAEIPEQSVFARKNYFYPDLPKGYQISQFERPIVGKGELSITLEDGEEKVIGITRAHLEEDAGKSLHEDFQGLSGIDLNRAGTPLLEIVSEPEMRSSAEAVAYLKKMRSLVRYLGISDGNMQEGSFRCDANVSIREYGAAEFGTRTEIKNLNSFRYVERAIEFEVARQTEVIEDGGTVVQETRLFDVDKNETRPMRSKEEANDYRYFPDPDLLPVNVSDEFKEQVRDSLPELPDAKRDRFVKEHELSLYEADILTGNKDLADYYEVVTSASGNPKLAANWVLGELSASLNKEHRDITECPVTAKQLAGLLDRIADETISGKIAKQVFEAMWQGKGNADSVIEAQGLQQITDVGAIEATIQKVLDDNPRQLQQYLEGKDKLFGFFVGKVMQATQGKANPQQVNDLLKKLLADRQD